MGYDGCYFPKIAPRLALGSSSGLCDFSLFSSSHLSSLTRQTSLKMAPKVKPTGGSRSSSASASNQQPVRASPSAPTPKRQARVRFCATRLLKGTPPAYSPPSCAQKVPLHPKLASIVSRFEKSMKDYERKMQAFNEDETDINDMGPDNDPGVPVDKQAKKTLKVIEKTLADATNLAATEVARVGGDVSSEEIKKLFEGVGGFFFGGEEYLAHSYFPTVPDIARFEKRALDAAYGNSMFEWWVFFFGDNLFIADDRHNITGTLGTTARLRKCATSWNPLWILSIALAPIGGNGDSPLQASWCGLSSSMFPILQPGRSVLWALSWLRSSKRAVALPLTGIAFPAATSSKRPRPTTLPLVPHLTPPPSPSSSSSTPPRLLRLSPSPDRSSKRAAKSPPRTSVRRTRSSSRRPRSSSRPEAAGRTVIPSSTSTPTRSPPRRPTETPTTARASVSWTPRRRWRSTDRVTLWRSPTTRGSRRTAATWRSTRWTRRGTRAPSRSWTAGRSL